MSSADRARQQSPFENRRDFEQGFRRPIGERKSVPITSANRLASIASGVMGAPRQWQYRPPVIEVPIFTVPKWKPRKVVKPAETPIPSAAKIDPPAPRPKVCVLCFREFPSLNAWGRHWHVCGADRESADGAD